MKELIDRMTDLVKKDIAIAFSGGVDSSLLLKIACDIAKKQNTKVYAVTFNTKLHPMCDLENAQAIAKEVGAVHHIIDVNEFDSVDIKNNPVDRCYRCKHYLFSQLKGFAKQKNIQTIIDGTNFDDLSAYRPGIQALKELGICSPLADLRITKPTVREWAKELGLSVSIRPSAPCLATRLPYNTKIDFSVLEQIDRGEEFLKSLGFAVARIRLHGDIARIEIQPDFFALFLEKKEQIMRELQNLGFVYITLDLEGFRSGSMDIYIKKEHLCKEA